MYKNLQKSCLATQTCFFLHCRLTEMNRNHVWLNRQDKSCGLAAHKSFSLTKLLCYLFDFTNVCQHLKTLSLYSSIRCLNSTKPKPRKTTTIIILTNVQCNSLFFYIGCHVISPPQASSQFIDGARTVFKSRYAKLRHLSDDTLLFPHTPS